MKGITAIIVNRRTLALTQTCVESLLTYYPLIEIVLVDNKSGDASQDYIEQVAADSPQIRGLFNMTVEPHHAVGLNIGVAETRTPYFLTLDSDVEVLRGEWIERMLTAFVRDPLLAAVGHVSMNAGPDGTRPARRDEAVVHYVHPFCALWNREKFVQCRGGFRNSGAPAYVPCKLLQRKGFHIVNLPGLNPHNIPVPYYVQHKWGGTRDVLAIQAADRRRREGQEKP